MSVIDKETGGAKAESPPHLKANEVAPSANWGLLRMEFLSTISLIITVS